MVRELLNVEEIERELKFWNIPGVAVSVVKDGELILNCGFGVKNLTTLEPVTTNTQFGIASCSKSFTSLIIGMLADEGVLDLDVPVSEYVPGFKFYDPIATAQVTLRDLLCHKTGLAGHDGVWPDTISRNELMHRLRYLEPNESPRKVAQYSNVMYIIAGAIVETVTGKTWEELVKERIFIPLGMDNSCCSLDEMLQSGDYATPYIEKKRHEKPEEMIPWNVDFAGPAASINSTSTDMAKWLMFQCGNGTWNGNTLISQGMLDEIHRTQTIMDLYHWDYEELSQKTGYGMGWMTQEYRGMPIMYHFGEIEGYCTEQFIIPECGIGIMSLANLHKPCTPFLMSVAFTIVDRLLGFEETGWLTRFHEWDWAVHEEDWSLEYAEYYEHWNINLMPEAGISGTSLSHPLEDYEGIYDNPGYASLRIYIKDSDLYMDFKEWSLPLEYYHYDTFKVENLKEDTIFLTTPLTFLYDAVSGVINRLEITLEPSVEPIVFIKRNE